MAGNVATAEAPKHSLETIVFRSVKRSRDMYLSEYGKPINVFAEGEKERVTAKINAEYGPVKQKLDNNQTIQTTSTSKRDDTETRPSKLLALTADASGSAAIKDRQLALTATVTKPGSAPPKLATSLSIRPEDEGMRGALALKAPDMPKPQWHPKWKLYRVISGHIGWVRALAVDPTNQWFASGAADRTIKIWDLASGSLKLTLTGHISTVRGLAVSDRHPYLFSVGEDKMVKCWDLEYNKVIRHYHGHLSAIYGLSLHPTVDVLLTCGRDATVRVWDMRTKSQVHCLTGHTNTVAAVVSRGADPQVISGSHDSCVRLWDLTAGKCLSTLTNHKKSVRAIALNPKESTFVTGAPDNMKQWYLPDGKFIQNLGGQNAIVNALACNGEGVLASGGDNGSLSFWDYRTGYRFQQTATIAQPGSLDSEAGIYCMTFDISGSRLLTGEADKTIKLYKEVENTTEETDPIDWQPVLLKKARF